MLLIKANKKSIINSGGSVWGLDWAPLLENEDLENKTRFLAIGGYKNKTDHQVIGQKQISQSKLDSSIQIWRVDTSKTLF